MANATIFVNNAMDLSKVDVMGFDYDYTLVSYTRNMERLIFEMGRDYLIDQCGYPPELRKVEYDGDFAIRVRLVGLVKCL